MKYFIVLILGIVQLATQAQTGVFGVSWSIARPTGNTADFINKSSVSGASFEYLYVPDDHWAVHFEGGWNYFYEKLPRATYDYKTVSLTGVQFRSLQSIPLLAGIQYIVFPEGVFKPYAGLNAGLMFNEATVEMGLYSLSEQSWQFTIKPEIGVAAEISDNVFVKLGFKYYQTFETDRLNAQSFSTVNLGIGFRVE